MGKPRGQGRYAALRLAVAGLRTVQLSILLAVMQLACCACALALDPSLDISQYAHTSWKVRDGFTKGVITSLAQTPDGYVWLGTESGLLRFDGVRPVQWQPPAGQQLPGSLITILLAARDGTLWIGTFSGLASWKDGKLRTIPELAGQSVTSILETHDGTVWIGIYAESGGGVCYIRSGVVRCEHESDKFGTGVMALYEDSNGTLWLGLRNGLLRWKPGSPQFFSIPEDPFGVTSFLEDAQRQLLFSSSAGIRRLVDDRVEPYPSSGSVHHWQVTRMFRDHDGGIWVGTAEHGLVHIREQGEIDVFSIADGLSGDYVTRFLEDREGSIWVATFDGVDRFRAYTIPTISTNQGLSTATALSVLASKDGSVWIGTVSALNQAKSGQISLFGSRGGTKKSDGKLNGRPPTSLFQDNGGRIWVTTSAGISGDLGYLQDDRFIPIRGFPGGTVRSITEVPSGHLWLASQQSGLIHVYEGRVMQQIPWAGLGHRGFAQVLAADPSQRGLWLGFQKGGVAYFADGAIRASYSTENGLGQGRVSDLRFGTRGALWAATATGLSRIKDGHVTTLTSTNGLPCDQVVATIEDNDHSMWLYLACGLVHITRAELDAWVTDPSRLVSTKLFDSYDGVRTHSAAGGFSPLMTKSADGKIWFLPWDGVSVIDPRHLPFNNIPPPVHIEKITADDKSYPLSNGVHLPAQIRNLDIDYTALSLVVPEKVRFRVKLEGQDKDWRELVNVRHVDYTNLPPKHYWFRVLACNNSGVWNEEGATLDFVIPPAWYQTKWFLAACVAAFLAMVWGIHELRLWRLAHQFNMTLEARVNERTRIARELHDTLLQSFQGLMLHFQSGIDLLPGRPAEARKTLETAIDRADQAIAEGRDAVQGLRASTVETNDLACAVRTLGEELRAEGTNANSALFEMEVEGTPRNLHPIMRDEVYRVAGEALRNAFRHARAQRIEVEILYGERSFRLRIRDDGKGIDPKLLSGDGPAGHYGLHGMRERAKLVGGRLAVWSKLDSGTEVELSIPASTAYAKAVRHRSWLSEKLAGQRTDFKETDVKETKTKS
jgi:signal transduction histidine kinase/ligand-binding sensor domain-containing protein